MTRCDAQWWLRAILLLAFAGSTWIGVRNYVGSGDEAFWLLFPIWVLIGAGVLKLFPPPKLTTQNKLTTALTGIVLLGAPSAVYLGLVYAVGARASVSEILVGTYFFAVSLEVLLLYAFNASTLIEERLVLHLGKKWKWPAKISTRLALYSLLVPFLFSTLSLHRMKILPNVNDPAIASLQLETVQFYSRGQQPMLLKGWFFPKDSSVGTILMCHGVGAHRGDLRDFIRTFHDARYQVLVFDFRGHGESHGHTVTYGHVEKNDVLGAYDYLLNRSDVDRSRLFALGVSMGGASMLLALPDMPAIRSAVVDSSFADLESVIHSRFRFFPGALRTPIVYATLFFAWLQTGIDGREISPQRTLNASHLPLLFIHGSADTIISPNETRKLFNAYNGPKQIHIENGAPHSGSLYWDPQRYEQMVNNFFQESVSIDGEDQGS